MTYVALLRGINVGGKAKVSMSVLKDRLLAFGLEDVRTYINSGNVIFESRASDVLELAGGIERAIESEFGFPVGVLVLTRAQLAKIAGAVPAGWTNDETMKCDVMFLWRDIDKPSVVKEIPHKPEIEDLRYVRGAVIHRIDKINATKSPINNMIGTDVYKNMTLRNINTVRRLNQLAAE